MLEIVKIGLLATLQGKSYTGARHIGMPLAGPAEPITMAIANKLAGNSYNASSIEFSILGGIIKAHNDVIIGIAGPIQSATINDKICDQHRTITLKTGDILSIIAARFGAHIYLSVNGGFDSDSYWNGNSTFLPAHIGGHHGRELREGDRIRCIQANLDTNIQSLPSRYRQSFGSNHVMRICSDNDDSANLLSDNIWTIGHQSNRIGYELISENEGKIYTPSNIPSRPVFPGTIQYPPSGNPYLLGVDAQTTGGYAIIGHVIRADRHIMGQIKSGDKLRFINNKPRDARRVYLQKLKMWREYIPDLQLY